ncbi:glycogen synthase [Sulfuriroseicoccus oceanibius]|uniref:Glycogen synthase n=1 Tax=Sulfuriroseicoccus oceanibius TaxID=2707525 RepID=A0A6B3L4W0_9BACT|nr:glycogen synthase [Sulfuriroseicoccus oceanibius]QQL43955.1 glycogen synthase [Sulfuriroseicoccus oceanibius]
MKSLLLTNEFPPYIYGGAGVHVDYLSRELSRLIEVDVRCYGDQDRQDGNLGVKGVGLDKSGWTAPEALQSVFGAVQRDLDFNTRNVDADVVHLHTWYTHFGGILAKLNYGIPMVLTVHSLEPLRPWKREQLGGGYDFSCWVEKTAIEMADAVVAVSKETKEDILRLFDVDESKVHIIYNGIDPDEYQKVEKPEVLEKYGVDPNQPMVLFVGRITRQKGIIHLVNAIRSMDPGFQVVLLAGAPDTPEIAKEMQDAVAEVQKERDGVIWIEEMLETPEKIAMYSHADVFCCPSIYEPFGIINLEAMACETAVVASAVGGIKEVVVPEETGLLVPVEQQQVSPFEPTDPEAFAKDLAAGVNRLMADPELREKMGVAGRKRAVDVFSWRAIAEETVDLYKSLTDK